MPTPRASDGEKGGPNQRGSSGDLMLPSAVAQLLPTPTTSDTNGPGAHGDGGTDLRTTVARMLPTPTSRDWKDHTIRREPHRPDDVDTLARALTDVPCAQRLLPTPRSASDRTGHSAAVRQDSMSAPSLGQAIEIAGGVLPREFTTWEELPPSWQNSTNGAKWGDYAPAIHRWEQILGRTAPAPTVTSAKGNPQLSPRFVEWMMGLPEGWVDDVPGLTRNEKLKALGNGVVSQQAVEAVLRLLALGSEVAA